MSLKWMTYNLNSLLLIAESTSAPASITERFGQTMKHAGVAVSVTTFTDVIAFLVGRSGLVLSY